MTPRSTPASGSNVDTIRIVIVEPSPLAGVGLREVIDGEPDMEVVGEVRSAGDALAVVEERAPDIVVMDVELQEPRASAATRRLTHDSPGSPVVIVGGQDDDASIMGAIEVGATGHVAGIAQPGELVAVIRRVADGEDALREEVVGRPDLVDRIVDTFREGFRRQDEPPEIPLTARELDILRYVAHGFKNREIADLLALNEQTVKNHLSSVMHKLGVPNRTHAVTFAVRQGWLNLDEVVADQAVPPDDATAMLATSTGDR
jgi:DNA-binding NarL/FixJ family response regulator